MKMKKVVSVVLVGALAATLLAGCSSEETADETESSEAEEVVEDAGEEEQDDAEGTENVAEEVEAAEDNAEEAEEASGFDGFEEMVTINVMGATLFDDSGLEEVMEAVNEITESEINVHVNYSCLFATPYMQQLGLMMAGGEALDLCMIVPEDTARFSVMTSQNQLMDISGYLDEYAPEMVELVADYLPTMTINGGIYGVPDYRVYNNDLYLVMRKDVLDELGLTEQAREISSWSDAEAIFEAVYEAQDSLPEELQTTSIIGNYQTDGTVITASGCDVAADDFSDHYGFDVLSDSYKTIYAEDGIVSNYWASDDFKESCDRVRSWYEKGWVYKDSATALEASDTLMSDGVCFCYLTQTDLGVEAQKTAATGYEVVCVSTCAQVIQTSDGDSWGWAVPVTAEEPEAAIAFLNLMYTNADIVNLLVYGIEGRDYELNDQGEAVLLEDGLYTSSDWFYGNQFLAYPAEGQGGNFREEALESMLNGEISPYYGFTIDTDPISSELAAVSNVIDQYAPTLQSGTLSTSETLDEMLSSMESAGVQIILDYYQDALDEWLAKQ